MENQKIYHNPLVVALSVVSVAAIIVAIVLASSLYQFNGGPSTIKVAGSTQQVITSDTAQWSASFTRTVGPSEIKSGSDQMKSDTQKVAAYLKSNGIADEEVSMAPLSIYPNYSSETDAQGHYKQVFTGYTLSQSFEVQSKDVAKIGKAATNSGSLIADGILFQSSNPQYFYSKLADLKIELVSAAAADAYNRAEKIARSGNSRLAGIRSAYLGVIQITPENSVDISAEGYYDTTSVKKKVTIIVHSTFFVK